MSIAKAEYPFRNTATAGKVVDKRKFWCEILGFNHPEAVCEAILVQSTPKLLQPIQPNADVQRYQAIYLPSVDCVKIWVEAQLPLSLAAWIAETLGIEAFALRDLNLRDA